VRNINIQSARFSFQTSRNSAVLEMML